jgi:RNase P/RNase MRP subunit POP5
VRRAFVGDEPPARAQQVAVWAQHRELFRAKDDVAVVAVEEGEQAALRVALDMASRIAQTRVKVRILEVEGRQRRCRREEVRDRFPGR